jgi:hypothetical protein
LLAMVIKVYTRELNQSHNANLLTYISFRYDAYLFCFHQLSTAWLSGNSEVNALTILASDCVVYGYTDGARESSWLNFAEQRFQPHYRWKTVEISNLLSKITTSANYH